MSETDQNDLKKKKRIRWIVEIALFIIAILIIACLLYYHTPKILKILESGSVTEVLEYIQSAGNRGRIILIGLETIETISIVLPAIPIYICAGILYGKLEGFLICYITNLILNLLIYLVAKKMHLKTDIFSKAEQNKTMEKLMKLTDKPIPLIVLMNLIPVVPTGMIPYVCAQTDINLSKFMEGIALGSFPIILFYVCCGNLLISGNYKKVIPILVVIVIAVILIVIFKKPISKLVAGKFHDGEIKI